MLIKLIIVLGLCSILCDLNVYLLPTKISTLLGSKNKSSRILISNLIIFIGFLWNILWPRFSLFHHYFLILIDTTSKELGKIFFIAVVCASNMMFFVYLALHFAKSYLKTMENFLDKVLSNNKEKKEKNVEGSIISAAPMPCQSVEEIQDGISLSAHVDNLKK